MNENKRNMLENIAKYNYYITYIMLSIFTIYAYIFYLSDLYEQGAHLFVLIFVPPIFTLGWPIMYFIMPEKTPMFLLFGAFFLIFQAILICVLAFFASIIDDNN